MALRPTLILEVSKFVERGRGGRMQRRKIAGLRLGLMACRREISFGTICSRSDQPDLQAIFVPTLKPTWLNPLPIWGSSPHRLRHSFSAEQSDCVRLVSVFSSPINRHHYPFSPFSFTLGRLCPGPW